MRRREHTERLYDRVERILYDRHEEHIKPLDYIEDKMWTSVSDFHQILEGIEIPLRDFLGGDLCE